MLLVVPCADSLKLSFKLELINSLPTSNSFSCLIINFANSLEPDQARSGSKLFDTLMVFLKEFSEKVNEEK